MKKYRNRIKINDGFSPELAIGANFDGLFEFPRIIPAKDWKTPRQLIPFSERNKVRDPGNAYIVFYEQDDKFADVIRDPSSYTEDFRRFAGIVSPDNSLYRDMPFVCQLGNIYRSRLIGSYFQRQGITVVGNCRWGDERTFTSEVFGEPVAFVGLPMNSIISVGTYGCIRGMQNKEVFKKGLSAMLAYLKPQIVIVYGAMPHDVFGDFVEKAKFINYKDWASICHEGGRNG